MVTPIPEAPLLRIRTFGLVATTFTLVACATSGGSPRRSPDRIDSAEIATSSAINAYELIDRLRPSWLRATGQGSLSGGVRSQVILVYLDGARLGDLQSLRSLGVAGIRSIQWLDAARAATVLTEVGSEPIGGAIVIRTN